MLPNKKLRLLFFYKSLFGLFVFFSQTENKKLSYHAYKQRAQSVAERKWPLLCDLVATTIERCYQDLRNALEEGDKRKEGLIYEALGRIYYNLKNFQKALDYHDQSLQIAKAVGDWASEVIAYKDLGEVHCRDPKKAIEYHNFVLKVVKNLGLTRHAEGYVCGCLGEDYQCLGDYEAAIDYHEASVSIFKEVCDRFEEGRGFFHFGSAWRSLGDFDKAKNYLECCLKITNEIIDNAGEKGAHKFIENDLRELVISKEP